MLHHIKKLFGFGQKADAPAVGVPYKVETPTASPVAAPVAITPAELQIVSEISDSIHDTDKPAKAKKAPTAKKAPAVKKPRAPKKPKAS